MRNVQHDDPAIGMAPSRQATDRAPSATAMRLTAIGGILGAIAASSCCIAPLVLFSLGISGAWIGNLTALAPYQPYFIAATLVCLGYGYWLVYAAKKLPARKASVPGRCQTISSRRASSWPRSSSRARLPSMSLPRSC
jgi:hypothetical protein